MKRIAVAVAFATCALGAAAQQPPAAGQNPRDVIPDKMPFDVPYGAPVSLDRAQAAINAAVAESKKRGWKMNVAVVDSGANLVAFARMDGAQLGSIAIAEHKARAAAKFRRETKLFESGIQEKPALPADARRRDRLARRHPDHRQRPDRRRGGLLGRHGLTG